MCIAHGHAVLCFAPTHGREIFISAGEDSIIQVSRANVRAAATSNAFPVDKLARVDHHRGPVTCIVINHRLDVLVSGASLIIFVLLKD